MLRGWPEPLETDTWIVRASMESEFLAALSGSESRQRILPEACSHKAWRDELNQKTTKRAEIGEFYDVI